MSDRDNLALARRQDEEMESDGTWAQLRQKVAQDFPSANFERRFIVVRADGIPAPALMLRQEPWTEELAEHWMNYLWEGQRAGRFSTQVNAGGEPGRATLEITGGEMGVALMFIIDLETGHFFRGVPERRPQEAAYLAMQHYLAVVCPPGAVRLGEFPEDEQE